MNAPANREKTSVAAISIFASAGHGRGQIRRRYFDRQSSR